VSGSTQNKGIEKKFRDASEFCLIFIEQRFLIFSDQTSPLAA